MQRMEVRKINLQELKREIERDEGAPLLKEELDASHGSSFAFF